MLYINEDMVGFRKHALILLAEVLSIFQLNQQILLTFQGEIVEVFIEKAVYNVADLFILVDYTNKLPPYDIISIVDVTARIVHAFRDDNIQFFIVYCFEFDQQKVFSVFGNDERIFYVNLFNISCFHAVLLPHTPNALFQKRADVHDVIFYISDQNLLLTDRYKTSMKVIQTLKRMNATIVTVDNCKLGTEECKQHSNRFIATKPEYALKFKDFSSENPVVKHVLQESMDCKQDVTFHRCEWDIARTTCNRWVSLGGFSDSYCMKHGNYDKLLTVDSIEENVKTCAIVKKYDQDNECAFNKNGDCIVLDVRLERRKAGRFDDARIEALSLKGSTDDPIAIDLKACKTEQLKSQVDRSCAEQVCQNLDCTWNVNATDACENVYFLRSCGFELRSKCRITPNVNFKCYPFYYARDKDSFVEDMIVKWSGSNAEVQKSTNTVKSLCKDRKLREHCSEWLQTEFRTSPDEICAKIETKKESDPISFDLKRHIGIVIAIVIILFLVGTVAAILLFVFHKTKPRKPSRKRDLSARVKHKRKQSEATSADHDETARTIHVDPSPPFEQTRSTRQSRANKQRGTSINRRSGSDKSSVPVHLRKQYKN